MLQSQLTKRIQTQHNEGDLFTFNIDFSKIQNCLENQAQHQVNIVEQLDQQQINIDNQVNLLADFKEKFQNKLYDITGDYSKKIQESDKTQAEKIEQLQQNYSELTDKYTKMNEVAEQMWKMVHRMSDESKELQKKIETDVKISTVPPLNPISQALVDYCADSQQETIEECKRLISKCSAGAFRNMGSGGANRMADDENNEVQHSDHLANDVDQLYKRLKEQQEQINQNTAQVQKGQASLHLSIGNLRQQTFNRMDTEYAAQKELGVKISAMVTELDRCKTLVNQGMKERQRLSLVETKAQENAENFLLMKPRLEGVIKNAKRLTEITEEMSEFRVIINSKVSTHELNLGQLNKCLNLDELEHRLMDRMDKSQMEMKKTLPGLELCSAS